MTPRPLLDTSCLVCAYPREANGRLKAIDPVQRFWRKVLITDGCWEWQASKDRRGYGQFWTGKKFGRAHRFSYELHFGPITNELFVLHRCDNRVCVRPDHLFLGTAKDNAEDMAQKGRSSHGEQRPMAKLTGDDVRQIKVLARQGLTKREIAARFGICRQGVSKIEKGLIWKHLSDEDLT